MNHAEDFLRKRLDEVNFRKLMEIKNSKLHEFIASYVELCDPETVFIGTDSAEDIEYIRKTSLKNKEEAKLATPGHTIHFDGYNDLARDRKNTRFLLPKGVDLGPGLNSMDREEGLREIHGILKGIMKGREMFVKFYTLGPHNSVFTIACVQLTDSTYVAHSEDLLYRQGYKEFVMQGERARFFKFVHSAGELVPAGLGLKISRNTDKRRMYMDLEDEVIFSTNTQYAGNTVGLKKLAMRLAINRASKENWLTEHMFIMGVNGPGGRVSYFTGAFPSACGKTSTATLTGERIVGDDIAYLRDIGGRLRAVNAEKGVFGIIDGINARDDSMTFGVLKGPGEIIFSNVLFLEDGSVFWNGMGGKEPGKGVNYYGDWHSGMKDEDGKELKPSHKNARFTLDLKLFESYDPKMEDPAGVDISGIIYGGRDSYTWVPVEEAFDWEHGIITKGAALESETTATIIGQEGVREFNPMSNIDFLSIPIGKYVLDNLEFGRKLKKQPRIFSVNYFLKNNDGSWMNEKNDKKVWLKWMELRVNGEAEAIRTPTGLIPKYEDLKRLFKSALNKEYSKEDYVRQFTIRVPESLAKIQRVSKKYREDVRETPKILFKVMDEQKKRLEDARKKHGDYISPISLLS